jgi:membrane-associated phospholipid phosphatase
VKQALKWTCGRYWPETWCGDNPSLIGNGDYGFHPFHIGRAYDSFPSGHAALVFALMAVLWFAYPRSRWLYGAVCTGLGVALVGMNYHFVSDVVAGAVLGGITGVYAARWFGLEDRSYATARSLNP